MTLLITAAGPEFSLACSDQRITAASGSRTIVLDERFNKHILFGNPEYSGSISYTGLARWRLGGKIYRLYDMISDAISSSLVNDPSFSVLCLDILEHVSTALPQESEIGATPWVELHVVTRHKQIPLNTITVISNFRTQSPWGSDTGTVYEFDLCPFRLFLKTMIHESDVVFGGMEHHMTTEEKVRLRHVVGAGGNAYQCAKLAARIMQKVANRTPTVGSRCAAVVHPRQGYVDTNLWRPQRNDIIAFLPRMVMPNGSLWGPSQFPADLPLPVDGQLPEQSLFYKAVIDANFKKRIRRLIFRRRKGLLVPGLMGFLGLMLFGQVMPGYQDFGFSEDRATEHEEELEEE